MRGLQNQNKSYRADGCLDLNFNSAQNQHKSVWIDFTKIAGYYNTAETQENFVDLKSISRKTNDFATIYRSGSGAGDKDDLFFVLNIYNQILSGSAQMGLIFYNGTQTATINYNYSPIFQRSNALNAWQKCQWALNSTNFIYTNGFTSTSWSGITQVQITFYAPLMTPTNGDIFLHGAWMALPQANSYLTGAATSPTITGAYYPDLSATSLCVAHNTTNNTFYPTLGKGIAAVTAGKNLVIADSYNYHPTSADYKTLGITQGNINIYAGYLEEPSISSKKTVINPNIVGAKTIGHAYYNDTWKTTIGAQRFTVGKSGAQYSTIQSAINATSNTLAYIDFIDSGVYSEVLTIGSGKQIIIQAIDGQSPTIQNSATGANVGITISGIVAFSNIIFKGNSADSEIFIGASGAVPVFYNCTFQNVGSNSFITSNGKCFKTLTTSTTVFNDCLFSDMGWYVNVIDLSAATASGTTFDNCICYLSGQTASANFIYANLYVAQTIIEIGCQVIQDTNTGYAYMTYNSYTGNMSSGGPVPFVYIYFNETNCRQFYGFLHSVNSFFVCKNYVHDVYGVLPGTSAGSGWSFNALDIQTFSGQFYCQGNVFYNVTASGNVAIKNYYPESFGNLWTNNNIFYNCDVALNTYRNDSACWDNNVAVNCGIGFQIFHYNNNATINGWIFSGCKNSVSNLGGVFGNFNDPWVYVNNSIAYNSPLSDPLVYTNMNPTTTTGTQLLNNNCSTNNPGLTNPFGLDFSWNYQSQIEATGCTSWTINNTILNSANGNIFYFMNFQGDTGESLLNSAVDSQSINGFYYSTITGFGIGFNDAQGSIPFNFCHFTENGIGARIYFTGKNLLPSNFTSCIFDDNDTAILARSGVILNHVTATNNTYGVTAPGIGLLSIKGAISGLFNILGCIFFKNSGFDYVLNFVPTGCIIGTSYYDIGLTTQYTATLLDPDYYFPAIKKLGYAENSPAFNVSGNMGARGSNSYLTPTLTSTTYASAYVGTIGTSDTTDLFYALENPQTFPVSQTAINPSGITFVTGDYASSPTAYAGDVVLKWDAPGDDAKISSAMQSAIIGMYQSGWFVAISNDMGATWTCYRVIKDAAISMEQKKYLFDDTGTNPYGNFSLHLRLIPNFNITDYTV
jgi:hypothetical protein